MTMNERCKAVYGLDPTCLSARQEAMHPNWSISIASVPWKVLVCVVRNLIRVRFQWEWRLRTEE